MSTETMNIKKLPVPKFDPKELERKPGFIFGRPIETYSYPLNQHDAGVQAMSGNPWWQMQQAMDTTIFTPHIIPDNIARGFVFEAETPKYRDQKGGPDMFGIDWEWVEQVGGSMVRPGKPFLEDIEDWYDKVVAGCGFLGLGRLRQGQQRHLPEAGEFQPDMVPHWVLREADRSHGV